MALAVAAALLALGIVMVYSASVALPDNPRFAAYSHAFFLQRHLFALGVGLAAALLALPHDLAAIGEVALSGDVRPVPGMAQRLAEAARLGFTAVIVPRGTQTGAKLPGLRLIEVDKTDLVDLPDIIDVVSDRPEKFIVFCDDLSFDSDDTSYKSLKAALEGGIEGRPDNVIFYATSNRRHLMPRDMMENERSTAINPSEAVEEKVSLSDRFGLWLGFHACDQDTFFAMIAAYCRHYGLDIPADQLRREAVEIRRADVLCTETAEVRITEVVGEDQDNVRRPARPTRGQQPTGSNDQECLESHAGRFTDAARGHRSSSHSAPSPRLR